MILLYLCDCGIPVAVVLVLYWCDCYTGYHCGIDRDCGNGVIGICCGSGVVLTVILVLHYIGEIVVFA